VQLPWHFQRLALKSALAGAETASMKRLWHHYSLSITLAALFLASWLGQFVCNWQEYVDDQVAHGHSMRIGGDFWAYFWGRTFENWQSEFLQLLTFVVLTAYLVHRGSHESKDSDERMETKLDELNHRLLVFEERFDQRDDIPPKNRTRRIT